MIQGTGCWGRFPLTTRTEWGERNEPTRLCAGGGLRSFSAGDGGVLQPPPDQPGRLLRGRAHGALVGERHLDHGNAVGHHQLCFGAGVCGVEGRGGRRRTGLAGLRVRGAAGAGVHHDFPVAGLSPRGRDQHLRIPGEALRRQHARLRQPAVPNQPRLGDGRDRVRGRLRGGHLLRRDRPGARVALHHRHRHYHYSLRRAGRHSRRHLERRDPDGHPGDRHLHPSGGGLRPDRRTGAGAERLCRRAGALPRAGLPVGLRQRAGLRLLAHAAGRLLPLHRLLRLRPEPGAARVVGGLD